MNEGDTKTEIAALQMGDGTEVQVPITLTFWRGKRSPRQHLKTVASGWSKPSHLQWRGRIFKVAETIMDAHFYREVVPVAVDDTIEPQPSPDRRPAYAKPAL